MSDTQKVNEVLRQLKKLAATSAFSINELRVILAMERAVARIVSDKRLAKSVIFKGGFVMLKVLQAKRFTRDIDALARGVEPGEIENLLTVALARDLKDALWFGDFTPKSLPDRANTVVYASTLPSRSVHRLR